MTAKEEIKLREILDDFLHYLLKECYCDSDVYAEEPTAIDDYINKLKIKAIKEV